MKIRYVLKVCGQVTCANDPFAEVPVQIYRNAVSYAKPTIGVAWQPQVIQAVSFNAIPGVKMGMVQPVQGGAVSAMGAGGGGMGGVSVTQQQATPMYQQPAVPCGQQQYQQQQYQQPAVPGYQQQQGYQQQPMGAPQYTPYDQQYQQPMMQR